MRPLLSDIFDLSFETEEGSLVDMQLSQSKLATSLKESEEIPLTEEPAQE